MVWCRHAEPGDHVSLLGILTGPVSTLLNGVRELLGKKLQNEADRTEANVKLAELEQQLQLAVVAADSQLESAQRDVIVAEAKSESWLARNWRPMLMLVFTFIILDNYVLSPIFSVPHTELPDQMWQLLKIGVGGYILGRSGEKAIANWRSNGS